jgi:TRAP-type C4-dicarboxylate transport system substrate-binding protein
MAYQPGRFVVTNATGLPVGIPDARTGSLALLDLYNKYKPEEFAQVKVLALFTTAQSNIMSKVPVRSLEDLQGLSLRGSGPAAQVLGALGANPVGMPMSDTPEALQKGVIKGLLSSLEVLKDFKYAETCRYVTLIDTVIYPFAVVMNQARWNSLPADIRQVMEDLIAEQSEWTGVYMDNHVKESVEWSKETYQVEVISLDAAEKARWDERLQSMTDKWIVEAKEKGLAAEEILADIHAAVEKHRK